MMMYQDVWKKALEKWGLEPQMDMVVEECSELIKAIMKFKRNGNSPETIEAIIDETADVQIMLFQLVFFLEINKEVNLKFHEKVKRLKARLKNNENGY